MRALCAWTLLGLAFQPEDKEAAGCGGEGSVGRRYGPSSELPGRQWKLHFEELAESEQQKRTELLDQSLNVRDEQDDDVGPLSSAQAR